MSRVVTPMSYMTDVFREFEKLKRDLEDLRDKLAVKDDEFYYVEIGSARHRCKRIAEELKNIRQVLPRREPYAWWQEPPQTPPQTPPKTPNPPFKPKLVS